MGQPGDNITHTHKHTFSKMPLVVDYCITEVGGLYSDNIAIQTCHILKWTSTPGATDASQGSREMEIEIIRLGPWRHLPSSTTDCCYSMFVPDAFKFP